MSFTQIAVQLTVIGGDEDGCVFVVVDIRRLAIQRG